jgi:peptidoglycan/LPS O-acetylase OafA/YrhL
MKLDAKDSLALKGLAILGIVLHNYFHFLGSAATNEFDFAPGRFQAALANLGDPTHAIQAFFSYFGHYGVQIFIFVSAYGLATKYWDGPLPWAGFVWSRVKRIYPMFLAAVAFWILWRALWAGPAAAIDRLETSWFSVALTALGIQNFWPGYDLPPVTPWWFLPFIMQCYCLWPLLRRFIARTGAAGLLALSAGSLVLTAAANPFLMERWSINLLESPLGHMPEFCLGIAAARYGFSPRRRLTAVALVVFLLASVDARFWLLSFASALVLLLAAYSAVRSWARETGALTSLGAWSMGLFLVNGFMRKAFVGLDESGSIWWLDLGTAALSTAACVAVANCFTGFEHCSRRMLVAVRSRNATPAQARSTTEYC